MFDKTAKLEKAYRRHPRAPLFARLADACLRRGKTTRALDLCEAGCQSFPEYPSGYFVLSRCYEAQGKLEKAREALDRGLRLDPRCPAPFRQLSQLYARMGNATLARKCLEAAAELDPFSESLAGELAALTAVSAAPGAGGDIAGDIAAGDELDSAEPAAQDAQSAGHGDAASETGDAVEEEPGSKPDEPFGRLEVMPEWEDAPQVREVEADHAVDRRAPPGGAAGAEPPGTTPAQAPVPSGQDEVAALGRELAELFDSGSSPPPEQGNGWEEEDGGDGETEVEHLRPPEADESPGTGDEAVGLPTADPAEAPLAPSAAPPREGAAPRTSAVARFGNGDEELVALLGEVSAGAPTDGAPRPATEDGEPLLPVPTPTLARLYAEQGFADRAAEIYRQVLQARPHDEEVRSALAGLEGH